MLVKIWLLLGRPGENLYKGLTYFSHKNRKTRLLKMIAKKEYENARGTAHLNMLLQLVDKLEYKLENRKKELNDENIKLQETEKHKVRDLRKILDKEIVEKNIGNISGVGQVYISKIKTQVFKTSLSDLRYSYRFINGIGDVRQSQINKWINSWEKKIPQLLKDDFPGKQNIECIYEPTIQALKNRISDVKADIEISEKRYLTVQVLLQQLRSVTVDDFIQEIMSGQKSEVVHNYLVGIFPEWEPVPNWFKDLFLE